MPRKRTVGYIVTGGGRPMTLGNGKDRKLYFGNSVTIFWSRRSANKSVRLTLADRPAFEEEFGVIIVKRCEEE